MAIVVKSMATSGVEGFMVEIDFPAEMRRIQNEMREVLAQEKQSQKMLEDAFKGIGYGID